MIAALMGCATPDSLSSRQRENLGTIGVIAPRFVPEPSPNASLAEATATAARRIATSQEFFYLLVCAVIVASRGNCPPEVLRRAFLRLGIGVLEVTNEIAAGGSAAGTIDVMTRVLPSFHGTEPAISTALSQLKIQEGLRDTVIEYASKKLPNTFVALPEIGPAASEAPVSYSNVVPKGIDGVLEISFLNVYMQTERESLLALTMIARARVVRISDDKVLADATYRFVSETRRFEIWAENDAEAFRAAIERGYQSLAEQIVAGILNRCSGIIFRDCAVPKSSSRDSTDLYAGGQRSKA
ncbi:MAG: hypothetical protein ACREVA_06455 [Burkholderiales bacterium]